MVAVTVVGDAFLDLDWTGRVDRVTPDAPAPVLDADGELRRAGGAGLAARLAAAAGAEVTLVTALGDDDEAEHVRSDLGHAGVTVVDLGLDGPTPVKLRLRSAGQSLARVDRNCRRVARVGEWTEAATAAVEAAAALLVSDYGRGMAAVPAFQALLHAVRETTPVVWDPHRRGPRPPSGLDLLTPNLSEAAQLAGGPSGDGAGPDQGHAGDGASRPLLVRAADVAGELSRSLTTAVAVTAGEAGAALAEPGAEPIVVPVAPSAGDPCGAGDSFAATVVVERAVGRTRREAVGWAVEAARRHVAGQPPDGPKAGTVSGGGETEAPAAPRPPGRTGNGEAAAGPGESPSRAVAVAESLRAAGRTLVVAGGCFDVLHAGHVRLLEAARRMGDALVVCLNSDRSVRRLKGPERPVNGEADRALVLRSLGCVDEVEVFDETTPCEALRRLRPHVFVKGADHAGAPLPEQPVLEEWGGRVVFVPLLEGRSTSAVLHRADRVTAVETRDAVDAVDALGALREAVG
jgi:D-beta-D-heptose 7-phosphate kinase / D-beta-D-heptose 1-phosphate adenosyltransferase